MDSVIDVFELPPLALSILDPFGLAPPEELQIALLRLWNGYPAFIPPFERSEIHKAMLALALRYANERVCFEAALTLKCEPEPARAAREVVDLIAHHDLGSSAALRGAMRVISYLLDGKPEVRKATLEGIAQWPDTPTFRKMIGDLMPELSPQEQRRLTQRSLQAPNGEQGS